MSIVRREGFERRLLRHISKVLSWFLPRDTEENWERH
jgi:hypothetical protein